MALKPCRECGAQVSTEAEVCPHCGVRAPAATDPLAVLGPSDRKPNKSAGSGCLTAIVVGVVIIVLAAVLSPSTPPRPPLDYSKPIFTDDNALMCPIDRLFDVRADHGAAAVADLFTSVFGRKEKEKNLGCQELVGGLRVYARRMKPPLPGVYVEVSFAPGSVATVFTAEPYLKN
jgi:hypothetical protein